MPARRVDLPGGGCDEHDIELGTATCSFLKTCYGISLTVQPGTHYTLSVRGVAQSGSAPRLGRGGRRFESARPDW